MLLPLLLCVVTWVTAQVTVTTSRGAVTGFHVDLGTDRSQLFYGSADVFLGIPFAKPPVGELRWKLPQRICDYGPQPINATYFRSQCSQGDVKHPFRFPKNQPSDDCLYLNVFTPSTTGNLPVMVWIHGGSLLEGGADDFDYKGCIRNFASRGVVLVTIQYRVSMTGFFTTYTDDFPANRGIYDQILALRWVQEEIAKFGGDPHRVTLFGQSAGAVSVSTHSLSPLSRGLFHRTLQSSGSIFLEYTVPNDPNGDLNRMKAKQICNFTDAQWTTGDFSALRKCLNDMSSKEIERFSRGLDIWKVALDGAILPKTPSQLALERPPLPAVVGQVTDEGSLIADPSLGMSSAASSLIPTLLRQGYRSFGDHIPMIEKMAINTFQGPAGIPAEEDRAGWFKLNSDIVTNMAFSSILRRDVEWQLDRGNKEVYVYEYNYSNNICLQGLPFAYHSSDNCYLWMYQPLWENTAIQAKITAADIALADFMADAWTNFAKGLAPNPAWSAVTDKEQLEYFQFDSIPGRMKLKYRAEANVLFNKVLPVIVGEFPIESVDAATAQRLADVGARLAAQFQEYSCDAIDPSLRTSSSSTAASNDDASSTISTPDRDRSHERPAIPNSETKQGKAAITSGSPMTSTFSLAILLSSVFTV